MHARPTQSAHSAITSYGNKRKILVLRVPSGARGPPCHQPITISLPKGPGAAWEAEGSSREGGGEGSQTFSAPFLSFWPHLAGIIGQISIYIIRCRWIPPPPLRVFDACWKARATAGQAGGDALTPRRWRRPEAKAGARHAGPDDPLAPRHQVAGRKSHFLLWRLDRL